jgi:hypothetical protein
MGAFLGSRGKSGRIWKTADAPREQLLSQAMSMPYGMRSSCHDDWLPCVWSRARLIETLAQECRGAREARQFSWRLSNKQSLVICANFERGLFKNAAHPPVDGLASKSQN